MIDACKSARVMMVTSGFVSASLLAALGSVVPVDATLTWALGEPGAVDEATVTCTVKVLVAPAASPVSEHVKSPGDDTQPAPDAKVTPLGRVPVTAYPPVLSEKPLFVTDTA